jgi:hypothetical protein
MERIIYVNYISRFANNIFQHAFAHIIKELVGGEIYYSPLNVIRSGISHDQPTEAIPIQEMPLYEITDSKNILEKKEWSGKFNNEEKEALKKTGVWFPEDILEFDGKKLVVSSRYKGEPIIVAGYYQDYRYYRGRKDFISGLLHAPLPKHQPGRDDIVLNFRGTDLSSVQMPLRYFTWILNNEKFETLWVITEDPQHATVQKLLKMYPSKILSNGAIEDFQSVRSAKKIIMTISTFCWMAAWLSDAERIYFPLGSKSPLYDKDNDKRLIIPDDERYVYVNSKIPPWMIRSFDKSGKSLHKRFLRLLCHVLKTRVFGYAMENAYGEPIKVV